MKLTTFFISKTKQIYAKALIVPESTLTVKAMLPWIFANGYFCTKTKLCNIFRTTDTKMLIKAILERYYKLLQIP